MKLSEIAKITGGTLSGGPDVEILGIASLADAKSGDLTFLTLPKYAQQLKKSSASAAIVPEAFKPSDSKIPLVRCPDPSLAFAKAAQALAPKPIAAKKAVHPGASVSKSASIGLNTAVMQFACVMDGAKIGSNCVIYPFVFIGEGTVIGDDTVIYPMVSVRERVSVGRNCIVHSGTVIGADGFGYTEVAGKRIKIPQLGGVTVGDDVEIGSNVSIDRARVGNTVIGRGTKIDNLVQVAHNVVIGEDCVIVAQTGLAGSAKVGNNVVLAAQSGVGGHVDVGDNSVVAGRAGVTKSIPAGSIVSGFPARPHSSHLKEEAVAKQLPNMARKLKELEDAQRKLLDRIKRIEDETEDAKKGR